MARLVTARQYQYAGPRCCDGGRLSSTALDSCPAALERQLFGPDRAGAAVCGRVFAMRRGSEGASEGIYLTYSDESPLTAATVTRDGPLNSVGAWDPPVSLT